MPTSRSSANAGLGPRSVRYLPGPSAAEANEALRAFVRRRQDRPWTPVDLAELDRLRQVWGDAVRGAGAWGQEERGQGIRSTMITAA